MQILITGGAGFIGLHLARHLLASGRAELTIVDNLQRGQPDEEFQAIGTGPRVRFMNLDLTDPASFRQLGGRYEQVYHLAAINGTRFFYDRPDQVLRTNILSLLFLVDWMGRENQHGKLLFTSSNEAYAGALAAFGALPIPTPETVPLLIEDPYNPRWSYAGSKLAGEL